MAEFYNDQWRLPNNENKDKSSNYSLNFNGSDEYISCGDNLNFERTDSFSASVWVKPDATEVSQILGKQLNSIPFSGYAIQTTGSNQIRIVLMNGTSSRIYVDTTSTISHSSWYHIAFTLDNHSKKVEIYLDGEKTFKNNITFKPPCDTLVIGGLSPKNNEQLQTVPDRTSPNKGLPVIIF